MGSLCHNVFKDDLPLMGLFMGLFVVLFIVFFIVLFMGLFSVLFSVFFRGLFKVPPLRGCLRLAGSGQVASSNVIFRRMRCFVLFGWLPAL